MSNYQLGEWDLSEIVKNHKSPDFQKKIKEIRIISNKFEKIKSKLDPKISSKKFMKILQDLEGISEKMSLIGGYATLSYSAIT